MIEIVGPDRGGCCEPLEGVNTLLGVCTQCQDIFYKAFIFIYKIKDSNTKML